MLLGLEEAQDETICKHVRHVDFSCAKMQTEIDWTLSMRLL